MLTTKADEGVLKTRDDLSAKLQVAGSRKQEAGYER